MRAIRYTGAREASAKQFNRPKGETLFGALFKVVRAPFLLLIWLYQKTISPDHGILKVLFPHGYCKFTPSCSEYTRLAIQKNGLLWGGAKGAWRILRCNPCSRGGLDRP